MPWPISSSQVKRMRTGPCGICGCSISVWASSMMTATPALSSAPSSVVPSVVMSVLPIELLQLRVVGHADDLRRVAGQRNIAAGIVADHVRLDVLAGRFGRGIDVGVEGHDRQRLVAFGLCGRRHGGPDQAVGIVLDVLAGPSRAARRPAACPARAGPASWDRCRAARRPSCRSARSGGSGRGGGRG